MDGWMDGLCCCGGVVSAVVFTASTGLSMSSWYALSMSVWVSTGAPGSPTIKKHKHQVSPQWRQRQSCSNSGLILRLTWQFYCIMIKKSLNILNINDSAVTTKDMFTSQAILVFDVCVLLYVCTVCMCLSL